MKGWGHGGHDGCGSQGDGCSGGCWNDNGGGHNIGAAGMDHNDSGQGNEMAGKGNVAGVDCGAQHGHGFGCGAYLASLTTWGTGIVYLFHLWTSQKGKEKGKYVCAVPP
jgi:hypothetical protein